MKKKKKKDQNLTQNLVKFSQSKLIFWKKKSATLNTQQICKTLFF